MKNLIQIGHYHFSYFWRGNAQQLPILLLHGFMGDGHDFDACVPFLLHRFSCLAVDLPGHGQTQVDGGEHLYQMIPIAQGLITLLERLAIQRCMLLGYSMGGRLALYLALQFPQYFSRVILESASPGLKTVGERQRRLQRDRQLAESLETGDFRQFVQQWYDQPLFASLKNHPQGSFIEQRRLQNRPQELAKSLRQLSVGCQPSLWERLSRNTVPLRLLVGALDRKFVEINQAMVQAGRLMELAIVDRCGHNLHAELSGQEFTHWAFPELRQEASTNGLNVTVAPFPTGFCQELRQQGDDSNVLD